MNMSISSGEVPLIVGAVSLDSIHTPFAVAVDQVGGAAIYSSVAATILSPAQLVGIVGKDFPSQFLNLLAARGVDLMGMQYAAGETFRWKASYDYDLSQAHTLSTGLNALENFSPWLPETYRDSKYILVGNNDPVLQLQVVTQLNQPRLILCDTMDLWISTKRDELIEVFRNVNAVVMNDQEARQLFGASGLVSAADQIHALGPAIVIFKKGEHGAMLSYNGSIFIAPAFPLKCVVDPTGAGDTFAGGFISYLSRTDNLSEASLRCAVAYGNVLASFSVEDFGVDRMLRLTMPEINSRYRALRQMSLFEEMGQTLS